MADHARSDNPAVQAQLDRFAQLSPGRDILGLGRIAQLMDVLGNPHRKLPPVFHVAGTNGKGSTCAFLRAMVEASGMTCHVYTSPHLVRFNERIRVAGKLIDDDVLAEHLKEVLDAAEAHEIGPSFFEATTAAAFLAFSRIPADVTIIEVGLGGRLDATNIIEAPAVCGIASLGIDHEAFLLAPEEGTPSDPYCRIAFEKAGIAKTGVPLVTQKYDAAMNKVIAECAAIKASPLLMAGNEWNAAIYKNQLHYKDMGGTLSLPLPSMPGAHQAQNAALAIAMLRHQDVIKIPDAAYKAAMGWTKWPARLQKLEAGPLTDLLPETEFWLDGGHNPDAGLALADYFGQMGKPLHLIIGMLANKDPLSLLRGLQGELDSITVVPVPGHDCHPPRAFEISLPVNQASDVLSALKQLASEKPEVVLIAGSLYLAGEVLKANGQVPD
jgi:dihydrofolate synthase / folylpolyglutamate synthase